MFLELTLHLPNILSQMMGGCHSMNFSHSPPLRHQKQTLFLIPFLICDIHYALTVQLSNLLSLRMGRNGNQEWILDAECQWKHYCRKCCLFHKTSVYTFVSANSKHQWDTKGNWARHICCTHFVIIKNNISSLKHTYIYYMQELINGQ